MRNQCRGQRKSLSVQLNSRPVRRTELKKKVSNVSFSGYGNVPGPPPPSQPLLNTLDFILMNLTNRWLKSMISEIVRSVLSGY